jgi:hypothetical protein
MPAWPIQHVNTMHLSYEWGHSTRTPHSIELDGKTFRVRENLFAALQHLRYKKEPRVVWIDAICINQEDDQEKSHQVRQMGTIYKHANIVVAWVGIERALVREIGHANSIEDLQRVEQFLDLLDGCLVNGKEDPNLHTQESWVSTAAHNISMELRYLCWHRTYWTRLWVIQEVVLAPQVIIQCGRFRLKWAVLEHIFAGKFEHMPPSIKFACYGIAGTLKDSPAAKIYQQRRIHVMRSEEAHSLLDTFLLFESAKCLDIRDKVFAIHGLARSCCQAKVHIDYTGSSSDICLAMITHHLRYHAEKVADRDLNQRIDKSMAILGHNFPLNPFPISLSSQESSVACFPCISRGGIFQVHNASAAFASFENNLPTVHRQATWKRRRIVDKTMDILRKEGRRIQRNERDTLYDHDHWLWPKAQFVYFTTDTGLQGETVFEVMNGDLVVEHYRRWLMVLRLEGGGVLRLVGFANIVVTSGIDSSIASVRPMFNKDQDYASKRPWEPLEESLVKTVSGSVNKMVQKGNGQISIYLDLSMFRTWCLLFDIKASLFVGGLVSREWREYFKHVGGRF